MNTVEKKCPLVRFKGFTDDWVELPLKDILIENQIPVKAPDGEYIRLGIRSHAKGTFHEVVPAGKGLDVDTMYMVEADNFIVNITFAWEHAVAITNEDDAGKLVSHRFPQYKFQKIFSPQFFQYSILDSKFRYNLELASPGGAGRNRVLNKNSLLNITRNCPTTLDEQTHIGTLFITLDKLVSLHQRKLDQLTAFKKAMLGKMFPQEGARVPEVRFSGFTDDWEQRKLGDLSEKVTEKNIHYAYTETLTNSAEYGIISQRDFFDKDISNNANLDGYYVVKNDAFVYNPRISTTAPVGPIKRNKLGRTGVMSPLYYVFQTHDIDNTFLETYFSTRYWHQFMKLNGNSGARADRFSIKDSALKEMPLPYPINKEQQCIGAFFEQIDNLITLHQHKLTSLQQAKKSLLQKMFI